MDTNTIEKIMDMIEAQKNSLANDHNDDNYRPSDEEYYGAINALNELEKHLQLHLEHLEPQTGL